MKQKKRVSPTKGKKMARDLLTESELQRLLAACGDGDAADRNRALISMLAATGMRVSEVLDLMPDDVDIKRRRVIVRSSDGVKPRNMWIHPNAVQFIKRWYKVRSEIGLSGCPVFCSLEGERMNPSYLRSLLPALAASASVNKRVYTDGLRHIFARRAYEAKATRRSIQVQLGHSNITTTIALLERLGLHDGFAEFEASFRR